MFSIALIEETEVRDYASYERSYVVETQLDIDNVFVVLMEICEILATYPKIKLHCSGFGLDDWNLDVRTDLSTIIGEFPNTLENLKNKEITSIDFFEQGVEREIIFFGYKDDWFAKCLKTVSDGNSPRKEEIGVQEKLVYHSLIAELTTFFSDFIRIAQIYCPIRSSHPYFVQWVEQHRHLMSK